MTTRMPAICMVICIIFALALIIFFGMQDRSELKRARAAKLAGRIAK